MAQQLTECPNCSAIWSEGTDEWEWQQCDSCGYPLNQSNEYDTEINDEIHD